MMKRLPLLLILVLFLIPKKFVFAAADNFSISSDITYQVSEDAITHVTIKNTLTNKTSKYYASSYNINLGLENIDAVTASDTRGPIDPQIITTNEGKSITVPFNAVVTGLNNSLSFTLSFDTKDIAQKEGSIWEIDIPGLADANTFKEFSEHVTVPESFGSPSYIKPFLDPEKTNQTTITFTKEQVQNSGISIAYGDKQTYSFTLIYHLKNTNLFPVRTEIAIPPTTSYQNVLIDNIKPAPLNVIKDEDQNWLAQYRLLPSEKKDIAVKGTVQLFLYPKKEDLPQKDIAIYTAQKPYWQTSDLKIKKLATDLKTPQAIYDYVVATLRYDYSRVTDEKPRLGAVETLNNPTSAVCLEFADLFVTLARAAGIPAREVDGFAYSQNAKQRPLSLVKDVLHAWPEYYDMETKRWVMVDPTWENTTRGIDYFNTLDFDHFAFAIKGTDSTYPVPAGGYKLPDAENTKDVFVTISKDVPTPDQTFDITMNVPQNVTSGLSLQGSITIANRGRGELSSQIVALETASILPQTQNLTYSDIPPYGFATDTFWYKPTSFLTNKTETITIRVGQKKFLQHVLFTPFFLTKWGFVVDAIAILTIIISIIATKAWRLSFLRRKG